jgi:flavin-dependent dehydrogenase
MAKSRIVTVGGGFAGLAAAKALRKTPAKVILIDRTNHHLFQPLLYQAATSVLTVNPDCDPNTQHFAQPKEHHGALGGSHWSGQSCKHVVSDEDRYSTPLHRMFRGDGRSRKSDA